MRKEKERKRVKEGRTWPAWKVSAQYALCNGTEFFRSLKDALMMSGSSKISRKQEFSKDLRLCKSERQRKWPTLGKNKMVHYVVTLDNKYSNGNLVVQAAERYHLFSWKQVAKCLNSNSKTGSLNQIFERLKAAWIQHVQVNFKPI